MKKKIKTSVKPTESQHIVDLRNKFLELQQLVSNHVPDMRNRLMMLARLRDTENMLLVNFAHAQSKEA